MNYTAYVNTGYSDVRVEIEDADGNMLCGFDKTQYAELLAKVSELRAAGNTVELDPNLALGLGKVEIAQLAAC